MGRGRIEWAAGIMAALLASGCSVGDGSVPEGAIVVAGETLPEGATLQEDLEAAAQAHDVPADLLASIAWVETRWQMIEGHAEFEGQEPAFGMMALRGEAIEHGAELIGASVDAVKHERATHVMAAAALLSEHATRLDIDRTDLSAWAPAVADLGGLENVQARSHYVHDGVYAALRTGVITEALTLAPRDILPTFPLAAASGGPGPDDDSTVWRPSPHHSSRPAGAAGDPTMVIIHSCEGSYASCFGWLTNSASKVSAHYVVNTDGSEVSQLVRENRKAWHIGANYKCSRNDGKHCNLNGRGSNGFTVGIEHAGYASQSSWAPGLLSRSAELVCGITKAHGIPRDRYHIVGHGQLQPYNRVDPGAAWPWVKYLDMVEAACGGQPASPDPPPVEPPKSDDPGGQPPPSSGGGNLTITIDSNAAYNGSNAQLVVGGSWTASSNVSGYFNTGYWWRSTGSSSDLAEFRAYLPSARKMAVEAWWPAASDRSPSAPFIMFDADGTQLDVVHVDQRKNGGQWVTLGVYDFKAGWVSAGLSRWTAPGDVVVADAVRFREVQ